MDPKTKELLLKQDLQLVIDTLIEENCFGPVVECIVNNLSTQVETLNKIKELIKDN